MGTTLRSTPSRIRLTPEIQGQCMTLAEFDRAIGTGGSVYELGNGVVEGTDSPHPWHLAIVQEMRDQLVAFRLANPGLIHSIAGSNECKIMLAEEQSERHPDLSVYLTPPPDVKDVWSVWIPALVIEVVSGRSGKRDYEQKPSEYLNFGVTEYWIVDRSKQQMTAMQQWRGQWRSKIFKAEQKYTTRLLPGLHLDLKRALGKA